METTCFFNIQMLGKKNNSRTWKKLVLRLELSFQRNGELPIPLFLVEGMLVCGAAYTNSYGTCFFFQGLFFQMCAPLQTSYGNHLILTVLEMKPLKPMTPIRLTNNIRLGFRWLWS